MICENHSLYSQSGQIQFTSACVGRFRSEDGYTDRARDSRRVWGKLPRLKMKACQSKCAGTGDAAIR